MAGKISITAFYFPPNNDLRNGNEWVRNLFNKNNITGTSLTPIQEDKLLELSCDGTRSFLQK
jgi:hypothetical protein